MRVDAQQVAAEARSADGQREAIGTVLEPELTLVVRAQMSLGP